MTDKRDDTLGDELLIRRLVERWAVWRDTGEVAETFRKAGGKPLALSDAAMRALVQRDVERWSRLVRELDLKPE